MARAVATPPTAMDIWCCGCSAKVSAGLVSGTEVYPRRADLADLRFWMCPGCGNYVGCHKGSKKRTPLGNIPTPELRKARGHIHAILDPIWKSGRMSRGDLYAKISKKIGHEYHTAEIRTIKDAREIYRFIKEISDGLT
jgi:hypothetical protein